MLSAKSGELSLSFGCDAILLVDVWFIDAKKWVARNDAITAYVLWQGGPAQKTTVTATAVSIEVSESMEF